MRNASFRTSLGFLFLIMVSARPAGAQLAAAGRAGVSLARAEAGSSAREDTVRYFPGERFLATVILPAYLWGPGAFMGMLAVGEGGECFDACDRRNRSLGMAGLSIGGGAMIALTLGGPSKYYPRCSQRARVVRAVAGTVAGSVPALLYMALDEPGVASAYMVGAGQLVGSLVALRSCRR